MVKKIELSKHLNRILIEDKDLLSNLDKPSFNFNNIDEFRRAGFEGFKTIRELFLDDSELPEIKGVYIVLYSGIETPEFLNVGSDGYFKGTNPNVTIKEIEGNWIENTMALYIGQAGGGKTKATLKSRLRQYLKFGQGKILSTMEVD